MSLWVEKMERRFRMEDDEEVAAGTSALTTLNGDRLGTAGSADEVMECMLVIDVRFDAADEPAEKTSET